MDVSVKGNFVQYHVENNDTEVWVINDFNTVSNERNYEQHNECDMLFSHLQYSRTNTYINFLCIVII